MWTGRPQKTGTFFYWNCGFVFSRSPYRLHSIYFCINPDCITRSWSFYSRKIHKQILWIKGKYSGEEFVNKQELQSRKKEFDSKDIKLFIEGCSEVTLSGSWSLGVTHITLDEECKKLIWLINKLLVLVKHFFQIIDVLHFKVMAAVRVGTNWTQG